MKVEIMGENFDVRNFPSTMPRVMVEFILEKALHGDVPCWSDDNGVFTALVGNLKVTASEDRLPIVTMEVIQWDTSIVYVESLEEYFWKNVEELQEQLSGVYHDTPDELYKESVAEANKLGKRLTELEKLCSMKVMS